MATAKKGRKATTRTTRSARAVAYEEGPRYRVTAESFINDALQPVNKEVTYYGLPGSALYPLNDEARARKVAVRDIKKNPDLDAEGKVAALRELSNEWNGVEEDGEFGVHDEFDAELDVEEGQGQGTPGANTPVGQRLAANPTNTRPLPDAERKELESHAAATVEATKLAQEQDTNFTKIKLQGHLEETTASKQGATPVTDGAESSGSAAKAKGK